MNLKLKTAQKLTLQIEALGPSGEGVASVEKHPVFVDGALPGEKVLVEVTWVKATYARAKLIEIIERSPDRQVAPCPYFERCGGCQIMHLTYPAQLQLKSKRVRQALQSDTVLPCIPSPEVFGYRNKIQLPVKEHAGKVIFGLYARRSNDLVPIDRCLVHCPLGEKIFQQIQNLLKTPPSELKYLLIRTAIHTKQALVTFVCEGAPSKKLQETAKNLLERCPEIAGVSANMKKDSGNAILGAEFTLLAGKDCMIELLGELTVQLSPASFFQINTSQATQLYSYAIELLELTGQETLLDAYCGIGTMSLLAAPFVKEVFAIECVEQAIRDANENARQNGITNCRFICGDAAMEITALPPCNAALLNPPRKGCDARFLSALLKIRPSKIVYVSCNPETLARDIQRLKSGGYHLKVAQPFDMFPQTTHVETVALLIRDL